MISTHFKIATKTYRMQANLSDYCKRQREFEGKDSNLDFLTVKNSYCLCSSLAAYYFINYVA